MRTEEIQKEAALYDKPEECYIHCARANEGPFTIVIAGDRKIMIQAVFNIMLEMERKYNAPFEKQMKLLRYGRRTLGKNEKNRKIVE